MIAAGLILVAVAALVVAGLHIWCRIARAYRHATRVLSEAEARANCRPYLDPITPAYYGLPPHNGTVADRTEDPA